MIKAILFDCYGVILGRGFWHTYAAAGGDIKKDADFIHTELDKMNSGKQSSKEFDQNIAAHLQIPLEQWQLVNSQEELPNMQLLDYIKTELKPKFKVGMISNASAGSIERRLTKEQLELFDERIISAEVGMLKPDPETYLYATQRLGVEPTQCVFTDDYEGYIDGAESVGMKGIMFRTAEQFIEDLDTLLQVSD